MPQQSTAVSDLTFARLGLPQKLLAILTDLRFTQPTPIQEKTIPLAMTGQDVIGIAQTGTGKTLAFALPLIVRLAVTKQKGLIVVPTRELAMQVDETLQKVGARLGLRRALLIGGSSLHHQRVALQRRPHIIIATPGRIIDHMENSNLQLRDVGVLILDEADRMLDMGFMPQVKKILAAVPTNRQTMLFSATLPDEIGKIATTYMRQPVRIEIARSGTVASEVQQQLFVLAREQKNQLLDRLLGEYQGTVLIFTRTKYGAKRLCRTVCGMGHSAAEIHSNLSLGQRRRALAGFKSRQYRVLVATDIAARGIDVADIELVINYDLPESPEDYVHRIGRTGRAGRGGQAISFITPDQHGKVRHIERLVRTALPISPLPQLPPVVMQAGYRSRQERVSPNRSRTTFQYPNSPRSHRGQRAGVNARSGRPRTGHKQHSRARVHL